MMPALIFFCLRTLSFYWVEYKAKSGLEVPISWNLLILQKSLHMLVIMGDTAVAEESFEYKVENFVIFMNVV